MSQFCCLVTRSEVQITIGPVGHFPQKTSCREIECVRKKERDQSTVRYTYVKQHDATDCATDCMTIEYLKHFVLRKASYELRNRRYSIEDAQQLCASDRGGNDLCRRWLHFPVR